MLCHHCHSEIEEGFRFCPKCGLRLKTVSRFLMRSEGRRAIRWGGVVAVIFFGVALIVSAVRQQRISRLKQGERDGVAYVTWLAGEQPTASTLELAIGKPIRSLEVANGRSITWYRVTDGFLGRESAGGIFHFRPDKPLPQEVLSDRRRQSEAALVVGELVTTYDGPDDLSLTTLASEKRPSEVTELIVWKQSAN